MSHQSQQGQPFVALAITVALFMALVLGVVLARYLGGLDAMSAQRAGMTGLGVVLIAAGNLVPKMRLFHSAARDPNAFAGVERFAGWTLVQAGAVIAGLWLFAPGANTMLISSAIATLAFALTIAAWVTISLRSDGSAAHPRNAAEARDGQAAARKRVALFQILFGLFWAFAMLFADTLWGGDVMLWMLVAFSIVMALSSLQLASPQLADGGR